ncbi:30S ribosomal protein S8 [Candidatus Woesearchaeota archaeon]|nr:30S ribosomal protein S8 [Candidatus Woesearchaeota archaeon]
MALNDTLGNALSNILNAERRGKQVCVIKPSSKMIKEILKIMHENDYIGSFNVVTDSRGGYIEVNLLGKINKCNVIKPRFSVKHTNFEKFEKRFLPAKGFGIIIISTSKGVMIHTQAEDKKLGGKLLAYCY